MIRYKVEYEEIGGVVEFGPPHYQLIFGGSEEGAKKVFEAHNPNMKIVDVWANPMCYFSLNNRYSRYFTTKP